MSVFSRSILLISTVIAASNAYAVDESMKLIGVTDFKFTLRDKPAVSIHFGESDTNHCSATVQRSKVKQGYTVSSSKRSNADFSIECNWDGNYFVESSNHLTFTDFSIVTLDKKSKTASIMVSFKLLGLPSNTYLERHDVIVPISGKHFQSLTMK
ncbi:hypothetical protein [Methylomonas fluvii]|uniref:Uncharacterized protein n=1 Tax=Methylomonas fluvii TaxID=1854564 RepID=A0ABR9DB54_9GAMM|nr:hypothetical protein [Methylomonas fluvii]MBD9360315.1 hypothetical protein [Methylomonas fluvii]